MGLSRSPERRLWLESVRCVHGVLNVYVGSVCRSPQHRAWEAAQTVPSGRRSLRRPTTLITRRYGYELSLENDIRACANRFGAETVGLERSSYVPTLTRASGARPLGCWDCAGMQSAFRQS